MPFSRFPKPSQLTKALTNFLIPTTKTIKTTLAQSITQAFESVPKPKQSASSLPPSASTSRSTIEALTSLETISSDAPKTRLPNVKTLPLDEFDMAPQYLPDKHYVHHLHYSSTSISNALSKDGKSDSNKHFSAPPAYKQNPQKFHRLAKIALQNVVTPENIVILTASTSVLLALSTVEASLYLKSSVQFFSYDHLMFAAHYTGDNFISGCVWGTISAKVVCQSMNLDPSIFLNTNLIDLIEPPHTIVVDPPTIETTKTYMSIKTIEATRYILSSYTLLTQLFRIVNRSLKASNIYGDSIAMGREPFFSNVSERVIRLCGKKSDLTNVSLDRYGAHVVPIFEDPETVKYLVNRHSRDYEAPVYWFVDRLRYMDKGSYERMNISEEWLCKTTVGGHLLVVEADLNHDENSLSLSVDANDLTLDSAFMAFREIHLHAKSCMQGKHFRILRIVLGDSTQLYKSGGGYSTTLRGRVIGGGNGADVIVDSRAPILLELIEWCEKAKITSRGMISRGVKMREEGEVEKLNEEEGSEGGLEGDGEEEEEEEHAIVSTAEERPLKKLLFFTDSAEYFVNLKWILEPFCIEVVDGFQEIKHQDEIDSQLKIEVEMERVKAEDARKAEQVSAIDADDSFAVAAAEEVAKPEHKNVKKATAKPNAKAKDNEVEPADKVIEKPTQTFNGMAFIHYTSTNLTCNHAIALSDKGSLKNLTTMVLVDKPVGIQQILNAQQEKQATQVNKTLAPLKVICSSVIHDDNLRQIRLWARMGFNSASIQAEIDYRFARILKSEAQAEAQKHLDEMKKKERVREFDKVSEKIKLLAKEVDDRRE